jgi:hypothetical protein
MENLINKWKKIINNEKTNTVINNSELQANESMTNNLTSSLTSERSNKFKHNKKSLRFNSSDHNLVRSTSSQPKSPKTEHNNFNEQDKLIQILTKTINYIQKNQDNSSFNHKFVLENLNDVMDLHIQNINNNKLNVKRFDEKEIIMKTKCDTAEKIIKDLEFKVLSSEKEKTKLKKQIDDLNEVLDEIKEKNDFLHKK